ncbi:MAG: ABC transporter ATP-binding protein [Anaerolineaceae bacterium]
MITLTNISISYADRMVLDIPCLVFEAGKRYGLIGENGSGKTTLLRILSGTLKPTTGEVTQSSADGMGYMPQSPYAFSFSVQKNVEMALDKSPNKERQALQAIRKVGMESLAQARGNKLSGGEAQRMAFARLIAKPRKLILLDEPTSSTDIKGTDLIEGNLLKYVAETGCTLIFSTHSPAQALRLAEEVIFLDQGRVVESGPVEQVLNHPQNETTRLFLQHWRI